MRPIEERLEAYADGEWNDPNGRNLLTTLLREAATAIRSMRSQCDFAHDRLDENTEQ